MTCRELIEFLMDYLAGDLEEQERTRFEEHLAACPPCVAYLKTYKETVDLEKICCCGGSDQIPEEVPPELVKAILAARKKDA